MPLAEPGPKNARTDEQGLRYYTWQGRELPSVTTLRRMAGLSFPLHQWSITQVVNRAVDNLSDLNRMVTSDDPAVVKAAKTWLRNAPNEERDRAASIGKRVHAAATSGGNIAPDIAPFLLHYRDWLQESGFEVLRVESQVFNLSKGYAGSFDLLGRDKFGDVYVVDIKSGKSTWPEHCLQVTGYAGGEFVGQDDVIDQEATDLLKSANAMALLHLRPDGWAWEEVSITPDMWVAFNGLLAYAKWAAANPTVETLLGRTVTGQAIPRLVK